MNREHYLSKRILHSRVLTDRNDELENVMVLDIPTLGSVAGENEPVTAAGGSASEVEFDLRPDAC